MTTTFTDGEPRDDAASPLSDRADGTAEFTAADPAEQSLAEALRLSFGILKAAMAVLVVSYLLSGTFSVGSNEVAVRLRFGACVGEGEGRVLERGTYLAAPFPFEQVIKVDARPATVSLDKEFWFETTGDEGGMTRGELQSRLARPLNPVRDGSLLTGDSGIVHARWTVTYHVADAVEFITNVGAKDLAARLVSCAMQQGIVQAAARTAADDILRGVVRREFAVATAQERLDAMRTGLAIDQLVLDSISAPLRVGSSFDAVTTAETDRSQRLVAAQQDRARILGEAAGEAADPLLELVTAYEDAVEQGREESAAAATEAIDRALADLTVDGRAIGGEAARIVNAAKTYRTQVVERVKSEAETFDRLLPQYERSPRLVLSRLWEDAREAILTGDVETFYTAPGRLDLQLNRDPQLQRQRQKRQLESIRTAR
jgi:membrane protease subunit HflK